MKGGSSLKRVNAATYLRHQITQAIDRRHDFNHEMHDTLKLGIITVQAR